MLQKDDLNDSVESVLCCPAQPSQWEYYFDDHDHDETSVEPPSAWISRIDTRRDTGHSFYILTSISPSVTRGQEPEARLYYPDLYIRAQRWEKTFTGFDWPDEDVDDDFNKEALEENEISSLSDRR